jgi:predicted amidohydrolase YtcJ
MQRVFLFLILCHISGAADADLILHNGKVVTVDAAFRVVEAIAVKDGRIAAVGTNADILRRERNPRTKLVNLRGKGVVPGLIDAHVHALEAGLSEFRAALPTLDSIAAIQDYIRSSARSRPKGAWIVVPRTLPPRLKEMRFPTRQDLDVTTDHPVVFDGSYVWGANSLALKISGITRDTPDPPGGEIVKGPDGEPTGILRNASQLLKGVAHSEAFNDEEKVAALSQMLHLYAAAGLTAVGDRAVTPMEVAIYEKLKSHGETPVRVVLTWRINAARPVEEVVSEIRASSWTTNWGDDWLRFGSFKVTLDGGQSVGTAYQRMPYGSFGRQLYGQTDPDARGTLFIEPGKLYRIMSAARDKGWQLTAHVQGGGAIDALLDAFQQLDREKPIAPSRSHVMHGSFMSEEALNRMQRMGVLVDVQPGWLHFDVPALKKVFGLENMRYFFPLRSFIDRGIVVAGGSDHMIGHDKNTAVNAFNPFFNMWASITRRTREGEVIYPQEKISRQEALKMWTIWAAYLQFAEKTRGSIEPGKFADFVVIDRDYLGCAEEDIRRIEPVATIVNGRVVAGRL